MAFVPISIDDYVTKFLAGNPDSERSEVTARLEETLADFKAGTRCACGARIWLSVPRKRVMVASDVLPARHILKRITKSQRHASTKTAEHGDEPRAAKDATVGAALC